MLSFGYLHVWKYAQFSQWDQNPTWHCVLSLSMTAEMQTCFILTCLMKYIQMITSILYCGFHLLNKQLSITVKISAFCFLFNMCQVQISAWEVVILIDIFHGVPQPLSANVRTLPQIKRQLLSISSSIYFSLSPCYLMLYKKFWEELTTYFPLIQQGPHRKWSVQFFYRCIRIHCHRTVFIQLLPRNKANASNDRREGGYKET
jgi:hypothetical protein